MPLTIYAETGLPFDATQWKKLTDILAPSRLIQVNPADKQAVAQALTEAHISILSGDLANCHLAAPHMRWIHCNHAGLTKSCRAETFASGIKVTGAAGRSSFALAEHAIMFALMLSSGYQQFFKAQLERTWRPNAAGPKVRALAGQTMAILGMGHTGQALALRAKAFGMTVLGYRRRAAPCPEGVDQIYSAEKGDSIDQLLAQADIVVLALNLSDATYHMIGTEKLAQMKSGAILINIARGELINQDALIAALQSGHIGGAGLDVTTPEPLPDNHPLWSVPNTLITPHFTAPLQDKSGRAFDILYQNACRFRDGLPLLNEVTIEDIWTH